MSNQSILGHGRETDPKAQSTPEAADSFGDILSQYEQSHSHKHQPGGEGLEATVIAISGESVFLDIGYKTEGIIPVSEFKDPAGNVEIKPGDKVQVGIKGRDPEGYYLLSKIKVERPKDWSSLEKAFAGKTPIAGGNLATPDAEAENVMMVAASSGVYFYRPQFQDDTTVTPGQPNTFSGGITLYGSLFSPYWEAHLVPTSAPIKAAVATAQGGV